MKVALIDADSIVYILAYGHREHQDIATVKAACDDFLRAIMYHTKCTHYLGVFSADQNFRHREYKQAKYKGQRREKDPYQVFWEPIIKEHFTKQWGFVTPHDLEADDVVVYAAHHILADTDFTICSPDKDLQQVAGEFFDYKKTEISHISVEQAITNLWAQVLTGDDTDNIKGVPKIGPAKAAQLLSASHPVTYKVMAINQYIGYFGEYYGPIIFQENLNAIQLLSPTHEKYTVYKSELDSLIAFKEYRNHNTTSIFDSLRQA